MTFLGVVLTIVTGYLAYLGATLERRVRESMICFVEEKNREMRDLVDARLSLVDIAVEAVCSVRMDRQGKEVESELYFLRHLSRLASNDPVEIDKALGALEAAGETVQHLLPYVERIRNKSNWPQECKVKFEKILRKRIESARQQPITK